MVKVLDSLYRPNERSTAWLKMKADYIDELGDTLDLVIIGGYFGEGKRAGVRCAVIIGCGLGGVDYGFLDGDYKTL